ncbi:DUF4062 domain-containing protein [Roseateles sp. BYS180W]|uniref:DUF4062 domain-containing protein n=1 Tax=Roseateles rivi TaxID=3299028 RepID=A0ABW7FSQ5_9BURK
MEKRYQVFVSSTFSDLQTERQEVIQALLELECIPAGMEMFPAADEDQWTLIKKVIDDCDYYMVILAGRYGSIGPDGLSYTEMEYRYALESGKPILGFVHKTPGELAANRSETTEAGKQKLEAFRELVQKKMCRFWETPADLGSQVSRSLVKLIKTSPGIGWVRGDLVPDESATEEILNLKRQVEELQAALQASQTTGPEGTSTLAQGEDSYEAGFSFVASRDEWTHHGTRFESKISISWKTIFGALSPHMIDECSEANLARATNDLIAALAPQQLQNEKNLKGLNLLNFKIMSGDFQTIKIQLRALGLITKSTKSRSVKDTATYWTLTPYGDNVMTRLRAIKKPAPPTE